MRLVKMGTLPQATLNLDSNPSTADATPPNRPNRLMQHRTRAIWILVCLACGFTVISFNLIQIQLVEHDKYWRMAIENHHASRGDPPKRGSIFDSDGNLLAETQTRTDVRLDGKRMNADHPRSNCRNWRKFCRCRRSS
jgi:cell division protein FtsI/penicillin-binding protein 2